MLLVANSIILRNTLKPPPPRIGEYRDADPRVVLSDEEESHDAKKFIAAGAL